MEIPYHFVFRKYDKHESTFLSFLVKWQICPVKLKVFATAEAKGFSTYQIFPSNPPEIDPASTPSKKKKQSKHMAPKTSYPSLKKIIQQFEQLRTFYHQNTPWVRF